MQKIREQLYARKEITMKRATFLIWLPFIAGTFVVATYLFLYYFPNVAEDNLRSTMYLLIGVEIFVVVSLLYYFATNFVFSIEKYIWIDSFFDKKNLQPETSWRIAKKLFLPYLRLKCEIFLRYVVPVLIIIFSLLHIYLNPRINLLPSSLLDLFEKGTVETVITLFIVVASFTYFFYLRVLLRYVPFVFLDTYGTSRFSYSNIFKEAHALNNIARHTSHMRALYTHLLPNGTFEHVSTLTPSASDARNYSGIVGHIFGNFSAVVGKEYFKHTISLTKIATLYILYQHARQQLYTEPQEINEYLYTL